MGIHRSIMDIGILSNVVVTSALVDMYAKCGSIQKASELFDKMSQRDVVSWTTMITRYIQTGFDGKGLETFKKMHLAYVKLLTLEDQVPNLPREIHTYIIMYHPIILDLQ